MARTVAAAFEAVAGPRLDVAAGYSIAPPRAAPTAPEIAAAFEGFEGSELRRVARQLALRQGRQVTEADDAVQEAVMELWGDRPELFRQPPKTWLGLLYEVARRS